MIEVLIKKFIPNYQNVEEAKVRTQYTLIASIIGIVCNILLCGIKVGVGLLMGSIAVMADGFNNLSDAASSIIGYIGMKMAEKPADDDHPFGHGRLEYIAAFIVSFLVMQVGFSLLGSSIDKLRNPEEINFNYLAVSLLIGSIVVKLWLALLNRKLGKRINSKVLLATAADSLGDVVATTATIISIVIYGYFKINLDGFMGILVSVLVMYAGFNIAKDTLTPLIGEAIDPKVYEDITNFVEGYEGIVGSHDLIVHNYGANKSMASIHAEVLNTMDVEVSHEIIDKIERDAERKLGIFLVIHMDPIQQNNEQIDKFRGILLNILEDIDERLSIHDFRYVDGKEQINLIFDLVVTRDYSKEMQMELKEKIDVAMVKKEPRCHCIITIENVYHAQH